MCHFNLYSRHSFYSLGLILIKHVLSFFSAVWERSFNFTAVWYLTVALQHSALRFKVHECKGVNRQLLLERSSPSNYFAWNTHLWESSLSDVTWWTDTFPQQQQPLLAFCLQNTPNKAFVGIGRPQTMGLNTLFFALLTVKLLHWNPISNKQTNK